VVVAATVDVGVFVGAVVGVDVPDAVDRGSVIDGDAMVSLG
jgi:hypothetical protein